MVRLVYAVPNVLYMGWFQDTGHVVYVDGERRVVETWDEVTELTKQRQVFPDD